MPEPIRIDRRLKRCRRLLTDISDPVSRRALQSLIVNVDDQIERDTRDDSAWSRVDAGVAASG